jgi:hypothetical protein
MKKVEIKAVIKYLLKKRMSPKEIHENFMDSLWKRPLPIALWKKWAAEF